MVPCRPIPAGIVLLTLVLPDGLSTGEVPMEHTLDSAIAQFLDNPCWESGRADRVDLRFHGVIPDSLDCPSRDPLWQRHFGVRPVVQLDPNEPGDEIVFNLAGEERWL